MASLQIDAIMDGSKDTGDAVDQLEFGMTFDLGDIGKVGLAYVDTKSHMMPVADKFMAGTPTKVTVTPGSAGTAATPPTVTVTTNGQASVPTKVEEVDKVVDDTFYFSIDENGMLKLAADGGEKTEYETDDKSIMYDAENVKYMAYLQTNSGTGASDGSIMKTKGTEHTIGVMPTVVTVVGELPTAGAVEKTNYRVIGGLYVNSACVADGGSDDAGYTINRGGTGCAASADKRAFKVDYLDVSDSSSRPLDPLTGEPTPFPKVSSFHQYENNTTVSVTVEGTRVDGTELKIDDGQPSVPTEVEVKPGTDGDPATPPTVAVAPGTPGDFVEQDDNEIPGSRDTHIAAQFNLGAVTAYLGHSQSETNGSGTKSKVTHYGVSGGIGDTGMSFNVMARNKNYETAKEGESPWLVGLTKSLGGGATAFMEHGNSDNGESGKTRLGFKVDF